MLLQSCLFDQYLSINFRRMSLLCQTTRLRHCHVVAGEKLPWTAKLANLTIYTIHHSEQMSYLLKPTSLCATLAVTAKYRCLQTDNLTDSLSLLGLCIHADMQTVDMAVSNSQVYYYHLFTFSTLDWFLRISLLSSSS